MKILLAPNAFKECLSAPQVAAAMAEGVREAAPSADCVLCPIADGGNGTLDALLAAAGGERIAVTVSDPLGRPIEAPFGLLGGGERAVIEMAEASGLCLLAASERNPLVATTRGTGELMLAALERGAKALIIGIGGSATVEGGTGMARALGYRFLDASGRDLPEGGGPLARLDRIDPGGRDRRIDSSVVWIASDVTNPLLGDDGAARVYGPQKGATPEMVEQLEKGLSRLAEVIERDLGMDVRERPGAGAAGGLGAGLMAFAGAECRPGVELVLEQAGFHEKLAGADLVLTGEGRVDRQTAFGKGPAGVARAARAKGTPVYCLAGIVEPGAEEALEKIGIVRTRCINPPGSSLEESFREAYSRLRRTAEEMLREFTAVRGGKD